MAGLHELGYSFVSEVPHRTQRGKFRHPSKKTIPSASAGVDVQRAGLVGLPEHLNHTGQIEVGEAAAEGRFGGRRASAPVENRPDG